MQGYLFAAAMPPGLFKAWVKGPRRVERLGPLGPRKHNKTALPGLPHHKLCSKMPFVTPEGRI